MIEEDKLRLLQKAVDEKGMRAAADDIGYSVTVVHRVLAGEYPGNVSKVLAAVDATVNCPVLGEITHGQCAVNRKRKFAATNPARVRLYRACRACQKGDANG